jgi:protein TonB
VTDRTLNIAFGASAAIHLLAVPVISLMIVHSARRPVNPIPIDLVELPRPEEKKPPVVVPPKPPPPPPPKVAAKPPPPPPPAPKIEPKPEPPPQPQAREIVKPEEPPIKKAEPEKPVVSNVTPGGGGPETPVIGTPGKGSGLGIPSPGGDIATIPGQGMGRSGTGTGGGPPGPGTGPARSYRPGTPTQTARATYPPLALRMGAEADVPLKVYVDEEGRVLKVEVTKAAGMGFDEEAVKTVKQYRFEPAVIDGRRVPTDFAYVYKFRIERR